MISKVLISCFLILSISASNFRKTFLPSPQELSEICTNPDSLQCKTYLISKFNDLVSQVNLFSFEETLEILGSTASEAFTAGVIIGLQSNPLIPSSCYSSITNAQTSLTSLSTNFSILPTQIFNSLFYFNDFVNKFTSSYDLCAFETLSDTLSELTSQEGFAKLLIRYGVNFSAVNTNVDGFFTNYNIGSYEAAGISAGKIFSLLIGWSL